MSRRAVCSRRRARLPRRTGLQVRTRLRRWVLLRRWTLLRRCALLRRWALLLPLLLAACGDGTHAFGDAAQCRVRGTVLRATNGEPVEGARVVGPRGVRARTDPRGRFELRGLRRGDSGAIRAGTENGWSASVPLRPLAQDELEVVLHLSRGG